MTISPRVKLIVNADDGNLTSGVSKGILLAHDHGIVSSTTIFANGFLDTALKNQFLARPDLGVGVHLNITLGSPVAPISDVRNLLAGDKFGKHDEFFFNQIDRKMLYIEYKAQMDRFEAWFGKSPTHIDTHHHLHRFESVFEVLTEIAGEYGIAFRLSDRVDTEVRERFNEREIILADHLLPDIDPFPCLNKARLREVLNQLPEGVVEMMCHPGVVDDELRKISSFVDERAGELDALSDALIRPYLKELNIELTNYGKLNSLAG